MSIRTSTAFRAIAIAAAALIAVPAMASDPAPKPAAKVAKPTRYCVAQSSTGSILTKKVCKTRDQWIAETGIDPVVGARK